MDRRDALKTLGVASAGALVVAVAAEPSTAGADVVEFDLLCAEAGFNEGHYENMEPKVRMEVCTFMNPRNGTMWQIGRAGLASAPRLPWFEGGKRYRILISTTPLQNESSK